MYHRTLSVSWAGAPFHRPTALAVASNGDRYVTDGYGNAAVHRFAADGRLLGSFGSPGSDPGQFRLPHALVVTANDQLVVADRENDRLQLFDATGTVVDIWEDVQRPCALATDLSGNIYVGNSPGGRLTGRFVTAINMPKRPHGSACSPHRERCSIVTSVVAMARAKASSSPRTGLPSRQTGASFWLKLPTVSVSRVALLNLM